MAQTGSFLSLALLSNIWFLPHAALLRSNVTKTQFTINDKVLVDGTVYAEGAAIGEQLGCHEYPKGTSDFEVCGCNQKLVVHMLTECQTYKGYDIPVGKCDCGVKACDVVNLESGYTDKFNWNAYSFEISKC